VTFATRTGTRVGDATGKLCWRRVKAGCSCSRSSLECCALISSPSLLSDREVATECPWLSGRIGTAYATGFQTGKGEDGGKFLLGVITLKHWAGYTVETDRSGYNSVITPFDLADSYLPAFRAAVRDGKAAGVMCSYNSINGVPTCADTRLTQILRGTWEFDGYITSDSGAIHDISGAHKYLNMSAEEGTAAALKAGRQFRGESSGRWSGQ
jgi:beta-glucosidase-like glycosyl hydrolase